MLKILQVQKAISYHLDEGAAWHAVTTIKILTNHQRWFETEAPKKKQAYRVLESWLKHDEVQQFLQVNRYRVVLWFNKEAFEQLLWWMLVVVQGGQVFINGQLLEEPWTTRLGGPDYPPTIVPPLHIFVLGDNRPNSRDSRYFGLVPVDHVTGRALFVCWPPDQAKSLR